jgi:hypothetical protein
MTEKMLESVKFFYQKSQFFRVIHADGVMGGLTPHGLLHFGFYSERPAFPQSQVHNFSPEGVMSDPVSTEGKDGLVRELDVDVIMSRKTAIEFRDWLDTRIKEFETLEVMFAAAKPKGKNDA